MFNLDSNTSDSLDSSAKNRQTVRDMEFYNY